jgi:prepilin peptidase CpaA
MIPSLVFYFILIELIVVSIIDIREKKIKNYWPLMNIVLFVLFLFIYPENYHFDFSTFLYPTVFLLVGFGLFLLKIMGAGDTKFLFSFFLLIPKLVQNELFVLLLYSTVLIGCFFFLTNFIKNFEKIIQTIKAREYFLLKNFFGSKFPFAPVILISWIWLGWKKNIFY